MSNIIHLDPHTQREVMRRAISQYENKLTEIVNDMGEDMFCTMDWQDLAQLFYLQGFTNGAIASATDDVFRDTVLLMADEISYQKK